MGDQNSNETVNPQQEQQQQAERGNIQRPGETETGAGRQPIDTDNDGRTRDPSDTRPTDDGGKAPPVQR